MKRLTVHIILFAIIGAAISPLSGVHLHDSSSHTSVIVHSHHMEEAVPAPEENTFGITIHSHEEYPISLNEFLFQGTIALKNIVLKQNTDNLFLSDLTVFSGDLLYRGPPVVYIQDSETFIKPLDLGHNQWRRPPPTIS